MTRQLLLVKASSELVREKEESDRLRLSPRCLAIPFLLFRNRCSSIVVFSDIRSGGG